MNGKGCAISWSAAAAVVLSPCPAEAHLARFVVQSRERAPTKAGAPAYEILRGRFFGELDPADPHNRIITDLAKAPRNARGLVEYSATFALARPVDPNRSSGVLFYDVPNRGNGDVEADGEGHIRVVSGWQGDIPPLPGIQTATVPTVRATGVALARFTDVPANTRSAPIAGGIGQAVPRPLPLTLDTRQARLFWHASDNRPLIPVPSGDFAFANCSAVPFPGKPDANHLCLKHGFQRGHGYTLVYTARDPKVLGVGFAATRDLNSFLRHATHDDAGNLNPIAGLVRDAVATGNSQSGNFLRSYVHLGFNADEEGRIVFDGINSNIAARQVPLNVRFGVPGGAANLFEAGSEGALWWTRYNDVVRRRGTSSLLARCNASGTCPKIIETFGSAEFWGLRMSPDLVGTDARRDLPLPANVRRYYFPGVTHGGSRIGGFSTVPEPVHPAQPRCVLQNNPNPSTESMRVVYRALIAWVRGTEPPASRYPTIAAGDLVAPNAELMGWPRIPGAPVPTGKINDFLDYDFGPGFRYADVSGVASRQPPAIRRRMAQLVPRVNADGNETAGVPSVQLLVPLGTYTGWNVMAVGWGAGGGCGFAGGFIPFARTRAERLAAGDPRLSLEERYVSHRGFVGRIRAVVEQRVAAGWLLADDAVKLIAQAEESDVLR